MTDLSKHCSGGHHTVCRWGDCECSCHRQRPSIDHTILSPSGRVSKRARAAALKREHDRLFPPGYWDEPEKTDTEKAREKAATLRRSAAELLGLAARGMQPRRYAKEAARLTAEADQLDLQRLTALLVEAEALAEAGAVAALHSTLAESRELFRSLSPAVRNAIKNQLEVAKNDRAGPQAHQA